MSCQFDYLVSPASSSLVHFGPFDLHFSLQTPFNVRAPEGSGPVVFTLSDFISWLYQQPIFW